MKVIVYVNDVAEDQGCSSVVRGTHRLPSAVGPGSLYDVAGAGFAGGGFAGSGAGRTEADGMAPLSAMPNHVKFAAKAGDCMVFDLATWHTAQPNTSSRERENLIIGYRSGTAVGNTGGLMTDGMLRRLDAAGLLGERKRELLGVRR